MHVNDKNYEVYPLFETMIDRNYSPHTRSLLDQVFEGRSIPVARRVILYHYFDSILSNLSYLKSGNTINKQISELELNNAL
jgi:hypothetical protein